MLDGDGTKMERKERRKEGRKGGRKEGKKGGRGREGRKGGRKEGRKEGEVQIACGKLRWEGGRQHAGRTGNRANSLGRASLGGSETACWTERKPCK